MNANNQLRAFAAALDHAAEATFRHDKNRQMVAFANPLVGGPTLKATKQSGVIEWSIRPGLAVWPSSVRPQRSNIKVERNWNIGVTDEDCFWETARPTPSHRASTSHCGPLGCGRAGGVSVSREPVGCPSLASIDRYAARKSSPFAFAFLAASNSRGLYKARKAWTSSFPCWRTIKPVSHGLQPGSVGWLARGL